MRTVIFGAALIILGIVTFAYLKIDLLIAKKIVSAESIIVQWPAIGILLFLGGIVLPVQIAELKAKKLSERKQAGSKFKKALIFEQMSANFKIKRPDDTKTSIWISLKHRLSHNMEDLGHALKILD